MKRLFLVFTVFFIFGCSAFTETVIPVDGTLVDFVANVKKVHLNEAQTNLESVKNILVIGDSISYGTGANSMREGFANSAASFMMFYIPDSLFWNASIGGQTSYDGINQISRCPFIPDILIVNFGMNDSVWISNELYKSNMQLIINKAKEINPNIKIVLCSAIIPALNNYHNIDIIKKFPEFEEILYELKSENSNVFVTPLMSYSAILINNGCFPAGGYTTDNVHPTNTMHQLMAIEVLKTVGFTF